MSRKVTRREFVTQSAVAAGAAIVAPHVLASPSPNSTLGVAVIGVEGQGTYSVEVGLTERIVAIADIDDNRIAQAMQKINAKQPSAPPKIFNDYRKMLDACKKDIDVVLIATPDHNHAPASMRAINLGKHVFCQKPLAHDIWEVRTMARAAARRKVLSQMGNQGHCGEGLRLACEYVWSGVVGNITETHTIFGRNWGGTDGRPPSEPVPPGVHWDPWIGPAPYRDYHDGLHPFSWRNYRDFGTGTVGDMACHCMDALFSVLKVAEAPSVEVECLATNGGSVEKWAQDNIVRYYVPERAGMQPVTVNVYDHQELAPEIMLKTAKDNELKPSEATLFIGDKGMFWTTPYAEKAFILPLDQHLNDPLPPRTLARAHGDGPIEDLFWCIKNDGVPCSNFPGASAPLTEFALLGLLAQRAGVGKRLHWDVAHLRCTNDREINRYVRLKERHGWEI